MSILTMNIGLEIGSGSGIYQPALAVISIVASTLGLDYRASAVHASATEPTLVIEVNARYTDKEIERVVGNLALVLGQEAIAYVISRDDEMRPGMAGPEADKWGPFNAEFFLTLNGAALADDPSWGV